MPPMTLNELAERVERAEGPDRALDHMIAARTMPDDPIGSPIFLAMTREEWTAQLNNGHSWVPAYTASLDAAMTLVPERYSNDMALHISSMSFDMGGKNWRAFLGGHRSSGAARTPALALCSAALRARAREEG